MRCPICGKETKENTAFCTSCGKKIPRCPTCGNVIYQPTRFCKHDGTELPSEILQLFHPNLAPQEKKEQPMDRPKQKKSRKKWWIFLLILLLAAGLGAGAFFVWKWNSKEEKETSGSEYQDMREELLESYEEESMEEEIITTEEAKKPEGTQKQEEEELFVDEEETPESTVPSESPKEMVHEYEIISGDLSWEEAKSMCEQSGGYLATITSEEEYRMINELAEQSGLTYLWIGGRLSSDLDDWADCQWITGEEWIFEKWYPGEPSMQDADGTKEEYLCLWKAKYEGTDIGWTFNDQRNDIVEMFPSISGKLGYICEYEKEVDE